MVTLLVRLSSISRTPLRHSHSSSYISHLRSSTAKCPAIEWRPRPSPTYGGDTEACRLPRIGHFSRPRSGRRRLSVVHYYADTLGIYIQMRGLGTTGIIGVSCPGLAPVVNTCSPVVVSCRHPMSDLAQAINQTTSYAHWGLIGSD